MNNNSFTKENLKLFAKEFPDDLKESAREFFSETLDEKAQKIIRERNAEDLLIRAVALSPFIKSGFKKYPELVSELLEQGALYRGISKKIFWESALAIHERARTEEDFLKEIRKFRIKNSVRIAIRDICGLSDFFEVSGELSDLATTLVELSLRWLEKRLLKTFGSPRFDSQKICPIVLGMGKLGARELNFSSDIDLIFSYRGDYPKITGLKKGLGLDEYFQYLVRKLLQVLSSPTSDGIVYRTDTRLRPFGDSGPLVMSHEAMLSYYEIHGRTWERYALIKAQPMCGDIESGKRLLDDLRPFIYRKYLDYSAISAINEIKDSIMTQHAQKGILDNIKLGPGGIRDAEFIVQTFQLIKGGRIKSLQTPYFKRALEVIANLRLLDQKTCKNLLNSYIFLRTTENRLQEYSDQQTHTLPKDNQKRHLLSLSLGFKKWDEFLEVLTFYRREIERVFSDLFKTHRRKYGTKSRETLSEDSSKTLLAKNVWEDLGAEEVNDRLKDLGFVNPEKALSILRALKKSKKFRSLRGQTQELLDSLMPLVLMNASMTKEPEKTLKHLLHIIEAVLRREIYLYMLKEYPQVLKHLSFICSRSSLIAQNIKEQPILLDELIDGRVLFSPIEEKEIKTRLQAVLEPVSRDDLELWLDEIRRFKKANVLKIAACHLEGLIDIREVGRELTVLSECIVKESFKMAQVKVLKEKTQELFKKNGLSIIAYGKLGSNEMGYSSDLDLIFLMEKGQGELTNIFNKIIHKFIFFLTTRTSQGILYEIDTRLRPNGSQGVLISTVQGFSEYQLKKAWTWEHQALIKARFLCGDEEIGNSFELLRKKVLCLKRDEKRLGYEIKDMKKKIEGELHLPEGKFHLKKSSGGLVDIEFISQYLVLKNAWQAPEITSERNTLDILDKLIEFNLLERSKGEFLKKAYLNYFERINLLSLDLKEPLLEEDEIKFYKKEVISLFNSIIT